MVLKFKINEWSETIVKKGYEGEEGTERKEDGFNLEGWKKAVKVAHHGAKRKDRDKRKNREEGRSEEKEEKRKKRKGH